MTGIVIFLCLLASILLLSIGYIAGVRYITYKFTEAFVNALFDCGVATPTIEKVLERTKELLKKYIGGK